ncbi:MAG: ABC transporter ATP-binding protein [Pseudomonadales bacterium]
MSVIEARNLHKSYRDVQALNGFDLTVEPGHIVGLIGPNGSGKTTAIKTLLGLCRRNGGTLEVLGLDPARNRKAVMLHSAYIADTGILPRWMKVRDLIDCFDGLHPNFDRARVEVTLADTEIRLDKKVQTLSKGMNVQLHLALIMAIDARLLVLDEPTLGLDLLFRQKFYHTLVNDYASAERSILMTTHEVREVEHLLTDVVFINHCRVVLDLEMETIGEHFAKLVAPAAKVEAARALNPISELPTLQGVEYVYRDADRSALAALGELTTPNLPDLFVAVVGEGG